MLEVVKEVPMAAIFAIFCEVLMSEWSLEVKVPYVELKLRKESSKLREVLKKLLEEAKN